MRKELIWVAIIGIAFGLIIAYGVYRINSSIKSRIPQAENSPKPKETSSEFKIALNKPENGDVLTESSVPVSGITKPLTWITVSGESGDYIIQADEKGVFNEEVDLVSGINQIKLTAFDPGGAQSTEKVLVVYSSSFQEKTAGTPGPASATSESDIRDKVAQKVAEAMNKPKAYLGVVTDITDSTIQIKSLESEIKQISTGDGEITVVNSKGTTSKIVKLTDVAIGDFIVAMGYVNSNSVLLAQRILITDAVVDPKINAFLGTFGEMKMQPDKKTVAYSFSNGKTTKIKVTSIKDSDRIIYVTNSSLRTIFLIADPQS